MRKWRWREDGLHQELVTHGACDIFALESARKLELHCLGRMCDVRVRVLSHVLQVCTLIFTQVRVHEHSTATSQGYCDLPTDVASSEEQRSRLLLPITGEKRYHRLDRQGDDGLLSGGGEFYLFWRINLP